MESVIEKLKELLARLEKVKGWDLPAIIDTKSILTLYVDKFFNTPKYLTMLKSVDTNIETEDDHYQALVKLKALITTLLEDIKISANNISITTEEEKNRILNQAREETANQRKQLELEAEEIRKIKDELKYERDRLIAEESKFNEFKTKLEFADKELDFQSQAKSNRKTAYIWAIIGAGLTLFLIILLCCNINVNDTFINIAKNVKSNLNTPNNTDNTVNTTIYFSFFKYVLTKLFLYSMLVYFIVFCFKNYNAQMHNHIIYTHKSNAFKSTLSLLNTARSEDGNDKLLIQATQAIFSHQQTGYSSKESEQTSPNLITNVIDSVSKKI